METKFNMDNFEHSLKQHADQFSMIPSKRVWNGVYNSLHPGSKWPSLTMVLIFLLTLIGIGPLFNTSKNSSLTPLPDNIQQSISEEIETDFYNIKTLQEKEYIFSEKTIPGKVVALINHSDERNEKGKNQLNTISHTISRNVIAKEEKSDFKKNQDENILKYKTAVDKPMEKIHHSIVVNIQDYKKNLATFSKENVLEIERSFPENSIFDLKNNFNFDDHRNLVSLLRLNPGKPVLINIENANEDSLIITQTDLNKLSPKVTKRNNKTTWIFFATPTVSTTYFTGNDFENQSSVISSSPLVINPGQVKRSMRFNARLGLNIGTELNHSFANGWEVVSGAQISYSGYNILANKVHPTFSYLYLKDAPNSIIPHKYITYYGSGIGLDEVVLHNNSLQLSVPVGIKHSVWKNNNIEIKIGTSVQPSLLLNGSAYILSTDGRNYVTDDELIRPINVTGEFNSSISFQGDKVKWHVGPVVRYQALSTYKNNYPVNEHLIDYGIRIGISK